MGEVLEVTALESVAGDPIATLSHGYRQRVGLAQAIFHQPKFLILDEPTRGLDPVQIVEMRNLIHDLKQKHTVLISSHILTEISQTCDRLLVLGKGQLLGSGTEAELSTKEAVINQITITVRAAGGDTRVTVKKLGLVFSAWNYPSDGLADDRYTVRIRALEDGAEAYEFDQEIPKSATDGIAEGPLPAWAAADVGKTFRFWVVLVDADTAPSGAATLSGDFEQVLGEFVRTIQPGIEGAGP